MARKPLPASWKTRRRRQRYHTWSVNDGGKGQYGSLTIDQNGKWTYTLDNDSAKVQAPAEGQKVTDTITVTVDDGNGGKTTQTITITITGTNDAAIITPSKPGDDAGSVKEDDKLTTGGKLDVTDKDAGEASFKPQTDFKGDHGKFSIDANGNWKYELDNNDPKVQALGVARSWSRPSKSSPPTAPRARSPSPSTAPTTPRSSAARPPAKSPMAATPAPPASSARPTSTSTTPTPGPSATTARARHLHRRPDRQVDLQPDPANTSVKELKTGESITETFTVYVDDGKGQDPRDHHRQDQRHQRRRHHHPEQAGRRRRFGQGRRQAHHRRQLDVVDPDKGEAVFKPQTDFKGDHGKFSIDANGNWKYELDNNDPKVQALGVGEKLVETFEVVTADGTKGTVTVTINGTNDAPVISGQASGEVTDGGNTSATGQLGKTDVDVNDTTPGPSATTARASTAPSPSTRPASGPIT